MSTAGTVMQISLWISLLLITSLLVIISARFFGKLNVAFLDENYSEIQFWGWISGSIIPFLGLITYASLTFSFDSSEILEDKLSFGLGSTWWLMLMFTSMFIALVFDSKTKQFVDFVKSKLEK